MCERIREGWSERETAKRIAGAYRVQGWEPPVIRTAAIDLPQKPTYRES